MIDAARLDAVDAEYAAWHALKRLGVQPPTHPLDMEGDGPYMDAEQYAAALAWAAAWYTLNR